MEAASVAWEPLGWTPVGFSEIEPFPSAILKHRFPNVPNYGDLTKSANWPLEPGAIDLLVGGTPCQSFSVGGKRKGLDDPRGQLMFSFLELAERLRPRWVLWENVPGVLSSGQPKGSDFGCLVQGLVERRYGVAWRVLDAVNFGTPQRRRRVFLVGCLGDWRAASEVLSLGEGLSGYLASGGKKRKDSSSSSRSSVDLKSKYFDFQAIGKYGNDGSASTLMARDYKDSKDLVVDPVAFTPSSFAQYSEGIGTIRANGGDLGGGSEGLVVRPMNVRRLTPRETERLQGFPDDWSRIPWKGKPAEECPDGPRYKACGNSMAVPVMAFIGNRIAEYQAKA